MVAIGVKIVDITFFIFHITSHDHMLKSHETLWLVASYLVATTLYSLMTIDLVEGEIYVEIM